MSTVLLDAGDMRRTLGRMAHEILEANQGAEELVVIGVLRRGYPVAKRLAFLMTQIEGTTVPCGKLDVRAYRDDRPIVENDETEIPSNIHRIMEVANHPSVGICWNSNDTDVEEGSVIRAAHAAAASGAAGSSGAGSAASVISVRRNGMRTASTTPTTRLPQPSSMKSFE